MPAVRTFHIPCTGIGDQDAQPYLGTSEDTAAVAVPADVGARVSTPTHASHRTRDPCSTVIGIGLATESQNVWLWNEVASR